MPLNRFRSSILPVLAAAATSLTLAAGADAQRAAVTLYAAGDFRGVSETFYDDVPNMKRSRVGNDQASSVRVAPGCTVILYAGGDFQGRSTSLNRALFRATSWLTTESVSGRLSS